jgi:hypothetical protein
VFENVRAFRVSYTQEIIIARDSEVNAQKLHREALSKFEDLRAVTTRKDRELTEVKAQLAKLRKGRIDEFALVRTRMEAKLAKQAEIHRLECQALLDAE